MNANDVLEAVAGLAGQTLERAALGEFPDARTAEAYFDRAVAGLGDNPMVSSLAQQAADAMKPALREVLDEYTPSFAAMTGALVGLSMLFGVWIAKKTILHVSSKRRSR